MKRLLKFRVHENRNRAGQPWAIQVEWSDGSQQRLVIQEPRGVDDLTETLVNLIKEMQK